jgi:hypothetical protein
MRQAFDSFLVLLGIMAAEVVVVGLSFGMIWAAVRILGAQ